MEIEIKREFIAAWQYSRIKTRSREVYPSL
jgi:hypothetical protein